MGEEPFFLVSPSETSPSPAFRASRSPRTVIPLELRDRVTWFTFRYTLLSMRKEFLIVGGVLVGSVVLMIGLSLLGARAAKPIEDVTTACVQHTGIGMHVHPHLKIVIDRTEKVIPADIGVVSLRCMRPLHTHDTTGTIHLEFPVQQDVRLGQFFQIWQQPFSRAAILERAAGEKDVLRVAGNGTEVQELENLLLHDKDDVVIEVKKRE